MLFLVATPIGHPGDISYRAVELLRSCNYILSEDTRRTRRLLDRYQIATSLVSYHDHNEQQKLPRILDDLRQGQQIALVSDGGLPLLSDPGYPLVRACKAEGIPFTALPGPCAAMNGLLLSGLPTHRFQFVGFLPRKGGKRQKLLEEIVGYVATTICYEAPHRLLQLLEELLPYEGRLQLAIAREMTKQHEQVLSGTPKELLAHFQLCAPRGEIVVLFHPLMASTKGRTPTL